MTFFEFISAWMEDRTTAAYNRITHRIKGCRPGSMVYYHELRHKQQDAAGLFGLIDILVSNTLAPTLFILAWQAGYRVVAGIWGGITLLWALSELDAELWSWREYHERELESASDEGGES